MIVMHLLQMSCLLARPKLTAFLQRIHARPACQRALATGGPCERLS